MFVHMCAHLAATPAMAGMGGANTPLLAGGALGGPSLRFLNTRA